MKCFIRKVISFSLVFAVTATFVACGKTNTKSNGNSSAQSSKENSSSNPIDITFSWWGGDSRHKATENAVNAFKNKHSNISVTTEYGAWSGWEEKQSLSLYGGNAADVMQINWNWIDNYGNNGTSFVDLNQYSDIIDLSQFSKEALEQCSVDGKLMAIPVSTTGCLFFWNKATFDKIGCEIPTDKDSLLEAGARFKAYDEEYYPLVFDGGYSRMILMVYYLESVYGKPWVVDGKLQYSIEEIKEGMNFICELEDAHVIPTLAVTNGDMADSTDKNPKFIDGKYAGIFVWDGSVLNMKNAVKGSVNVPGQDLVQGEFLKFGEYNGGFTKISMAFAITSTSEHPKESAMLINYLLNDPEGIELCAMERGLPLSAKGLEIMESKGLGDPTLIKANKDVQAHSKFALDSKFESSELKANPDGAYEKIFGKLSFDEYDAAQAADLLYNAVNETLAQ